MKLDRKKALIDLALSVGVAVLIVSASYLVYATGPFDVRGHLEESQQVNQ
jgi:hypothetical protein